MTTEEFTAAPVGDEPLPRPGSPAVAIHKTNVEFLFTITGNAAGLARLADLLRHASLLPEGEEGLKAGMSVVAEIGKLLVPSSDYWVGAVLRDEGLTHVSLPLPKRPWWHDRAALLGCSLAAFLVATVCLLAAVGLASLLPAR